MKALTLVLIISAVCLFPPLACSEDWQLFAGDGKGANDYYYDKSSVTMSADIVAVLSKNVLPEGYVLTKVEINCRENTFMGIAKTDYDKTGKIKDEAGPMLKHSAIPKDSVLGDLKKVVCAN